MVSSMTGYGRSFYECKDRNFTIEIRSVNHRYLDLNIKMPRSLTSLEDKIRKKLQKKISRGKIDIYITQTVLETESAKAVFNKNLGDSIVKCLKEMKVRYEIEEPLSLSLISRFPDIITIEQKDEDFDEIWEKLQIPLQEAIDVLLSMRLKEGIKLKEDIQNKCLFIDKLVGKIGEKSQLVVEQYRVKLNDRIKELMGDNSVDESRLAMEVAIFSDKACIDEEIVRLKSHILQLKESLNTDEPVGRKMDFIVQEMNREANTIASKANDADIIHFVLDIKNNVEKIREQVQNIQ